MAGRIESEEKKTAFIEVCENLNPLKVVPEKLLQAQKLVDTLKRDEIDMTMLYKCGCPSDWIKNAHKQCKAKKNETKPKYSNECTTCWLYNLTDEIEINQKEKDLKDILDEYRKYKSLNLDIDQLTEVLAYLGWQEIYDFGLFIDTIKDMKRIYDKYGGMD